MHKTLLSALIFTASNAVQMESASNMQTAATSQSYAQVKAQAMIQDLTTDADFDAEYEQILSEHAQMIADEAVARLEVEQPLLEVCQKGQDCRDEVDRLLTTTIAEQWEKVLQTLRITIESTKIQTAEIVQEGWDKKVQCFHDWPCCTFGPEYQANVKQMMISSRNGILEHYNHFVETESHRLDLHDSCPEETPQTCDELPACWDGSVRDVNWPDCSCPKFVHADYPCPNHECSDLHTHDDATCQCECNEVCPEGMTQDANSCECSDPFVEPVTEPIDEPVTEPVDEPVTEPVDEPVDEPVTEPVDEPVDEPVTEPVDEPVDEPVTEPVDEPVTEPVDEPVTEPVDEPIDDFDESNSEQPVDTAE